MTATLTPAPTGRPRLGKEPRVSMSVSVDPDTAARLQLWTGQLNTLEPHASPGQVLDRLVRHGRVTGFNPKNNPPKL